MNKFKKILATALACALTFGIGTKAFADEGVRGPSLFEILTGDTGGSKIEETKKTSKESREEVNDYEKDPSYQEEFKARYDLYMKILEAKEIEKIDEKGYIDILNKKAASKEDLEKVTEDLTKKINDSYEKVALDVDIDSVKEEVKDYILYGKLLFLNTLDKSDIKNLYLFYEANVNSYSLTKADENGKKPFKPVLEEIYKYILEIDEKVKEKIDISEEDKKKTSDLFDKLEKTIKENSEKILSHQATKLVKTSFLTSGNKEPVKNQNSAFYKSTRPGIKEAYENLEPNQRDFLDQINTNNDDYISDEEIKANGQYTLPLEDTNFIKPFYGNAEEIKKSVELSTTQVQGQTPQTTPPTTTPQNPATSLPETVTLSKGDNQLGTGDEKSKDVPTTVTKPASQVKTGIRGVGYLGIVLVLAIIAFVVLGKKKEK